MLNPLKVMQGRKINSFFQMGEKYLPYLTNVALMFAKLSGLLTLNRNITSISQKQNQVCCIFYLSFLFRVEKFFVILSCND